MGSLYERAPQHRPSAEGVPFQIVISVTRLDDLDTTNINQAKLHFKTLQGFADVCIHFKEEVVLPKKTLYNVTSRNSAPSV